MKTDMQNTIEDLEKMKSALSELYMAHARVAHIWANGEFDFNEVSTNYPYDKSFDDLNVERWVNNTILAIDAWIAKVPEDDEQIYNVTIQVTAKNRKDAIYKAIQANDLEGKIEVTDIDGNAVDAPGDLSPNL